MDKKEIKKCFQCVSYVYKQLKILLKKKIFLAEPVSRYVKKSKLETINYVRNFYENDEHWRVLLGMKDVSVERKHLILANLHELYSNFKYDYSDAEVGFSKFCSLCFKMCVLASASGTHSVCVYTIHQNMIILVHAAEIREQYILSNFYVKKLKERVGLGIAMNAHQKKTLLVSRKKEIGNYGDDNTIEYSQWISTDKTKIIRFSSKFYTFIDDMATKLEKLNSTLVHCKVSILIF